jgi:spore maturation protein CgeB
MRIAMLYQSLVSDWNHGNAHFLRGVAAELLARGHDVSIYEPADSWSARNQAAEYGGQPERDFERAFPALRSTRYTAPPRDIDADLVIVHEWNSHDVVRALGEWRRENRHARLLFHDTHHRSVTDPSSIAAYDLSHYDGVLAYGEVIRQIYCDRGWAACAWTWHEAADTRVFFPREAERAGDVVWIGNWGDDERTANLHEFLLEPVRDLSLSARIYGVRYPQHALDALERSGIEYAGWLANYRAPEVFAQFGLTVHVPRRPYVETLPGIPTIRPFEALACGIPLICSPWEDTEHLFRPGTDYLIARDGSQMKEHMRAVLEDRALRKSLARNGLERIRTHHTCAHRVDELMDIYREIAPAAALTELAAQ